ncbi:ERF family protein [Enterococcus sp. 2201sp1_2201st1_B8_2201SCRN_220225]|uniref:ERF family protein n=1 Tax=unclassified Enterococcus TaxID=2608891 RepID=UPI0034A13B79
MTETAETPVEQKNLMQKLSEIMAVIERIPKRGHNNFHDYDYALESDIKDVVRKELSSRNIMMISHELSRTATPVTTKKGSQEQIITLEIEYTLIDADSGETTKFVGYGDGQDAGDKAVYKAKTGALKYALTSLFLIPTGDDPETDGQSLQPKYIPEDKVQYLRDRVEETANIGRVSASSLVGYLKNTLKVSVDFTKFDQETFDAAVMILAECRKEYERQNQIRQNQQTQPQNNRMQWGSVQ